MYQPPETIVQLGKSNIETAIALASIALQGTERIMQIQLKSAKDAIDQGMRNVKALSGAKNVQELIALQSSSTQPDLEKALAYSRSLYDIASDTQSRINQIVSARITNFSGEMLTALDKAVKATPGGSQAALAALKSAVTAANDTYGTMTRAARQASDIAANSVVATAKQVKKKAA